MAVTLSQDTNKESKAHYGKLMSDTVATEGFKIYTEYLSNLRAEAMLHILSVDVESVQWRARLRALDEVLGVPDIIIRKARFSQISEDENG